MNDSKPQHPEFEELLALTLDELSPERTEELREHLSGCPACLTQVRTLLDFSDTPPTPEQEIGDAEEERAWQRLSAALGEPAGDAPAVPRAPLKLVPGQAKPAALPPRRRILEPAWWASVAAATIFGAAIGPQLFPPREEVRPVRKASLRPPGIYLRGEEIKPTPLPCPQPNEDFGLEVGINTETTPARVFYEITTLDGSKYIKHRDQATVGKEATIEIRVPRSLLPNGKYVVWIRLDENSPAEEYPFSVDCQP